jgi:hypothetical protein
MADADPSPSMAELLLRSNSNTPHPGKYWINRQSTAWVPQSEQENKTRGMFWELKVGM